jgi:hypothetical protein
MSAAGIVSYALLFSGAIALAAGLMFGFRAIKLI